MFTVDQSPNHIEATPAAQAHLTDMLASSSGNVMVVLTERGAAVLKSGEQPPRGAVRLGDLDEAGRISCVADDSAARDWWRRRARLDLSQDLDVTYDLTDLSDEEVFATLASGPLPRL